MAPFDGKLTTKISPLIEGQVPDFVQADHPKFVQFLKAFYQFLEAAELQLTVVIDSIRMETVSDSFIVSQGDIPVKFNTEIGTGSTGKFDVGEVVTGRTSKAVATVLIDDLTNVTQPRIFVTSQQKFIQGEIIDGGTSGAQATITKYRANPIQNIQQLLEYSNTDNTTSLFLDEMYNQFLDAIPKTLASGLNKRNLIKNIRDLYSAKGTSEGHKLFLRMMFGQEADIVYPNQFMLRTSKGNWTEPTIMRVSAQAGSDATDIVGQTITGKTSGTTSVILNAIAFFQAGEGVSELEIDPDVTTGDFILGETITSNSNTQDIEMKFTVKGFVSTATVDKAGALYSKGQDIRLTGDDGNDRALVEINETSKGGVTGVEIDNAGSGHRVGDTVTFTKDSADSANTVDDAKGFVSVIDGSILLETAENWPNAEYLVYEPDTVHSVINFNIVLEGTDSLGSDAGSHLVLNGTGGSNQNENYRFITEETTIQHDLYGGDDDRIQLDEGAADTEGEVRRIILTDGGGGYSELPSITVNSQTGFGTGTLILATSTNIGQVTEIKITDGGFNYSINPEGLFNTHMVLKDVTGIFTPFSVLSTELAGHVGKVVSYNSTNRHLEVQIENRARFPIEMTDPAFTEGMQLEHMTPAGENTEPGQFIFMNNLYENQGGGILLEDGSGGRIISNALETYAEMFLIEGPGGGAEGGIIRTLGEVINDRIELETEARTDERIAIGQSIKLDGFIDNGNIILNGTDGSSTNAGDNLLYEDDDVVAQQSLYEGSNLISENTLMYPNFIVHTQGDRLQFDGHHEEIFTTGGWVHSDRTSTNQKTSHPVDGTGRISGEFDHFLLEDASADAANNHHEYILMESFHNKRITDLNTPRPEDADQYGQFLINQSDTFPHTNLPATRLVGEQGETFIFEGSQDVTIGEGTFIVIDNDFIDGTEIDLKLVQEDGSAILNEQFGDNIMQESGLNIGDFPDVFGDKIITEEVNYSAPCYIILNGVDSASSHADSYIVSETDPTFIGDTISDSDGASGVVVSSDLATGTFNVDVSSKQTGFYLNTDHHISEGVVRIQDSFFYQDFSYEIRLGQSVNSYMDELKKAVHPVGFAAFGRVTIANSIAASMQVPVGGSVVDYDGDELFTPTLASMFDNIFQTQISRRLAPANWHDGEAFDKIVLEDPYIFRLEDDTGFLIIDAAGENMQLEDGTGNIVLDGTDGSSTNAGDLIYTEVDDSTSYYRGEDDWTATIITEDALNKLQFATERSTAPSADVELDLLQKVTVTVNLPKQIYRTKAGGWTGGLGLVADGVVISNNIEMEDGSSGKKPTIVRDIILLDGFEESSGAITHVGDGIEYEDSVDGDFGSDLTFKDLQYLSNDDIVLEQSTTFNDTVALEYATDPWVDVNTPSLLLLNGTDGSSTNANSRLQHEDDQNSFGDNLVFNGTDSGSSDADSKVVSEDILNGEISLGELEENHTIVQEGRGIGDTGNQGRFVMEDSPEAGEILLETAFVNLILEGDTFGRLLTEQDGALAVEAGESGVVGDSLLVEHATTPQKSGKFILESTAILAEDGTGVQIPEVNFIESNFVHFTRPAAIRVEASGRIAIQDERQPVNVQLEDSTDNLVIDQTSGAGKDENDAVQLEVSNHIIMPHHGGGFVLLDGTDGSSSNAGAYVDFEIGTRPPFEYDLGELLDAPATYDSTLSSYDSSQQSFDQTV